MKPMPTMIAMFTKPVSRPNIDAPSALQQIGARIGDRREPSA